MSSQKHSAEALPDEVQLRLVKRSGAEQDRYVNLDRIANALEHIALLLGEDRDPVSVPVGSKVTLFQRLRTWVRARLPKIR